MALSCMTSNFSVLFVCALCCCLSVTMAASCPQFCTSLYAPVCGSFTYNHRTYYQTFGNTCEMEKYFCKNPSFHFVYSFEGECLSCGTQRFCTSQYEPVCVEHRDASGQPVYNTLDNDCLSIDFICKSMHIGQYVRTTKGQCTCQAGGHRVAPGTKVSICTCQSNGKWTTDSPRCGCSQTTGGGFCAGGIQSNEVTVAAKMETQVACDSWQFCSHVYEPICSVYHQSGKIERMTHSNKCEMDKFFCQDPTAVHVHDYVGDCVPCPAPQFCSHVYEPVCVEFHTGHDSSFVTLPSACAAQQFVCETEHSYVAQTNGECK